MTDETQANSRWGDLRVVLSAAVLAGIVAAVAPAFDSGVVDAMLIAGLGAVVQPFIRAIVATFDDAVSPPSQRVVQRCLAFIAVAGLTYGVSAGSASVENLQGTPAEALPLVYGRSANQEDVWFSGAAACPRLDAAVGWRSYQANGVQLSDVVIWQRDRGFRWREEIDSEAFGGVNTTATGQPASRRALGVACGPAGIPTAFGWDTATDGSAVADGAIWQSHPGGWSRVGDEHFGGAGEQEILHLSHGASSNVLMADDRQSGPVSGSMPTSDVPQPSNEPMWVAIWRSETSDIDRTYRCSASQDGRSWTDVGEVTSGGDSLRPVSVGFADGLFVAHAANATEIGVFTSRNCREWTRASDLPFELGGRVPSVSVMRLHQTWLLTGWVDGVPILFEATGDGATGWRSLDVGNLGASGAAGIYAAAADDEHGFLVAWDTARDGNPVDYERGENLVISLERKRASSVRVPLVGDVPRAGVLSLR